MKKALTVKKVHKIPCLILEWSFEGKERRKEPLINFLGKEVTNFVWRCYYYLNVPLSKGDIRLEENKETYLKAPFGWTKCTGPCATQMENDGKINVPFRDGKHIEWDAKLLKLPMFVISEGKVQQLFDKGACDVGCIC
jgi:hypothetical protein